MVRQKHYINSLFVCLFVSACTCVRLFTVHLSLSNLKGTMSSRGKLILMADADGATKFPDLEKVEAGLCELNPKPVCLSFVCPTHVFSSECEAITKNACLSIQDNMAISCGSRAHLEKDSVAQVIGFGPLCDRIFMNCASLSSQLITVPSLPQRSMLRTFLMYGFHFLVWFLCVRGIKDTQCGFKLFTREAALKTFSSLHVERW